MGSNSNRRKGINDWISALPDEVLCHILSFVPTKFAVRTSVLSKRWSSIWASVPNLDFKCNENDISTLERFLTFVDRVLAFRKADVKKFRLHCYCRAEDVSRIDGWICSAIEHKVVELDLSVFVRDGPEFELPQCIFMSEKLEVLKLSNCETYGLPTSGGLLTLKTLHVSFDYPYHDTLVKFFSCVRVLEELTINGIFGADEVLNCKVSDPELKALTLSLQHDSWGGAHDHEYYFSINCPKLQNLYLKQDVLWIYSFEDVQSLVEASVKLFDHNDAGSQRAFPDRATVLLAGISNVKYLSLSAHRLKAACLPAFDNLNQLNLILHDCCKWDLLVHLLKKSPNLEGLVLEHKDDSVKKNVNLEPKKEELEEDEDKESINSDSSRSEEEEREDYEDTESITSDSSESEEEIYQWNTPETVPICLSSRLKTISIKGFKGRRDEKEMAKYLLENCEVLNKMTILTDDFLYAEEEIYKEFFMFRKGSSTCQVEFI